MLESGWSPDGATPREVGHDGVDFKHGRSRGAAYVRRDALSTLPCRHDADGAIGIGVGATIEGLSLHDLLDQFEIPHGVAPDAPVHFGGPVEPRRGFVVHSSDWSGQDTIDVAGRWSLSSTVDVLRAIAEGSGPTRYLVALGYAGWGGGQLEGELTQPGWFHVAGDEDLLFDTPAGRRWTAAFGKAGIDTRLLVPDAGTA
jgi:putative transcriptional regulator